MRKNGSLLVYLRKLDAGLKRQNVEVPCGNCTACCRSNFEVDVSEHEAKRFKASRKVENHFVLDRQDNGDCIYLVDGKCSTYHDRPRTCRIYDCRYHMFGSPFPDDGEEIRRVVAEWEPFSTPTKEDRIAFMAITIMINAAILRDPKLIGLAFMILDWKKLRPQAFEIVSRLDAGEKV